MDVQIHDQARTPANLMPSAEHLRAAMSRCPNCGLVKAEGAHCQRCYSEDPAYRAQADGDRTRPVKHQRPVSPAAGAAAGLPAIPELW